VTASFWGKDLGSLRRIESYSNRMFSFLPSPQMQCKYSLPLNLIISFFEHSTGQLGGVISCSVGPNHSSTPIAATNAHSARNAYTSRHRLKVGRFITQHPLVGGGGKGIQWVTLKLFSTPSVDHLFSSSW
jgi:hypothetical protein